MSLNDIIKSIDELTKIISASNNIVFFGGAGVSTESNIPDFRSESGIYKTANGYSNAPEVMLSHSFFMAQPQDFYDFYKNKMIYKDAEPNLAHSALAELENRGKLKAIITQNIDGLHQLAGSKKVLELHGSIYRNYCLKCHKNFNLDYVLNSSALVPHCDICNNIVRPDVVLYEESLNMDVITAAADYLSEADVLIVGGTSLTVYPAAGLLKYYNGNKLVLINKSPTSYDGKANIIIEEKIGTVLNSVISSLYK